MVPALPRITVYIENRMGAPKPTGYFPRNTRIQRRDFRVGRGQAVNYLVGRGQAVNYNFADNALRPFA